MAQTSPPASAPGPAGHADTVAADVRAAAATPGGPPVPGQRDPSRTLARSFLRSKGGVISLVVLLAIIVVTLLADQVAPYDPEEPSPAKALLKPVWAGGSGDHLLGTDELGRDLLSRLIFGARTALALAFGAATISAIVGTVLGLVGGMNRRWIGPVVDWLCDVQLAFPNIVLALVVITSQGNSIGSLLFVLSIFGWVHFARVVRSEVLTLRQADFVLAARGSGGSTLSITFQHILPNVMSSVLVLWTFAVATVLLLVSGLSFLGLGVQPPASDWGQLFASGRAFLIQNPWYAFMPAVAITVTVLCATVLGRTLRKTLNPRTR
ncbi:ABC transporter permease [Micromonospora profundi]|uniref:ABC transporter permease n=1 Tax=Micromonospora profundi TaxID=1420889 RepID=A0AAJ6L4M2_9ACTN|nr:MULTISPECIES: ABC transporter permease [Micromonospora]WLS48270.1 ABC transporter permease [Micromonospora profundi]